MSTLLISYLLPNNINSTSNNLNEKKLTEIYSNYYTMYKKKYTNGKDFSFREADTNEMYDINSEIQDILCDFEKHLNKRGENLSDSLFSDMLDEIGKNNLISRSGN